jgi:hypothetical protein
MNINLEKLDSQNLYNKKIINEINKNFTEFNINLNKILKKSNDTNEQLNSRIDLLDTKLNNLHTTINFLFSEKLQNIPTIQNSNDILLNNQDNSNQKKNINNPSNKIEPKYSVRRLV